jgi:hypothetical protein
MECNPLTITGLNCCQLKRIATYSLLSVNLFLFRFTNKTVMITDIKSHAKQYNENTPTNSKKVLII